MFSLDEALNTPIGKLSGWRLDLRCSPCDRVSEFWFHHLVYGKRVTEPPLSDLLPRLRCDQCRAKPAAALLANQRLPGHGKIWKDMRLDTGLVQIVLWDAR